MLRAFAQESVNLKYLPEELSPTYRWTENDAWERLALDRGYVKISENRVVANDPRWVWLTLKPLVLEGEIYDYIHVTVTPSCDVTASITLFEDEVKIVLREGVEFLRKKLI